MVVINEWLPNPVGSDTTGEWVELYNSGGSPVRLDGWRIENASGRHYNLSGSISGGDYLLLNRADTKLALRNSDEKLFLYDAQSKLVDESELLGTAQEGKSIARVGDYFLVSVPSPGASNGVPTSAALIENQYSLGAQHGSALRGTSVITLAVVVGVVLAAITLSIFKNSNDLQELFFGRYQEIR